MKKEKLLLSMNLIDDKYIEEAKVASIKKKRLKRLIILVASMTLIFALGLFLFLPFSNTPDVSEYSDSEYYEVIKQMSIVNYQKPKYNNNFEVLVGGIRDFFASEKKESMDFATGSDVFYEAVDGTYDSDENEIEMPAEDVKEEYLYDDVTDNQVKGVTEGDLFKRNDKYIFYLGGRVIRAYSINGLDSSEVGSFTLNNYVGTPAMYISSDGSTLVLVFNKWYIYRDNSYASEKDYVQGSSQTENGFSVITLDVSDPSNIVQKNQVDIYGSFIESRVVGDELYLVSNFYAKKTNDYHNEEDFIPHYNVDGETVLVPADNIYVPETIKKNSYIVLTKLDFTTLEIESSYALLSFFTGPDYVIYATKDSFYIARNYYEVIQKSECEETQKATTEICRIDFSSGELKRVGSVFLEGHVNDQYSLDVYNGVLRVFTSIGNVDSKFEDTEYGRHVYDIINNVVNASLYCVDINTFDVIASVDRFAPDGENVKSARFDKEIGYVCTSVQLTDPVFMFDLSDLGNITYKDTGTVEGFSSSLVDFAEGYLLGIGIKNWGNPKIEIYKEEGDKVVSVSAVEISNADISGVYKSYYIDRQRGYIGLGVNKYGDRYECVYMIMKFENEKLRVVSENVLEYHGSAGTIRGTFIDGFFYILSEKNLTVVSEESLS